VAVLATLAAAAHAGAAPEEGPSAPVGAEAGGAQEGVGPARPDGEEKRPAPPAPIAPGEAEELQGEAATVASFERFFYHMNRRVGEVLGEAPFQSFENLGGGTMRVTAGAAWLKSGVRQQRRNAVALYRSWRVANRYQPVGVIIADADGVDYIIVRDTPRGLQVLVRE
jgi:hypothetical protein